jgi:hypothetical protein
MDLRSAKALDGEAAQEFGRQSTVPPMKHPEAHCDYPSSAAPLALRWRCPVCGRTAIMRITTLATVCDGETIRKVEPEPKAE